MPIQLFPLVPKAAGFLKDGSLYQGDYCTDGQWVRFYQGKPKKIGGQRAIKKSGIAEEQKVPQNCMFLTSIWSGNYIIYIAINSEGIWINNTTANAANDFIGIWEKQKIFDDKDITKEIPFEPIPDALWQSQVVVASNLNQGRGADTNAKTYIALFGCSNLNNINNTKHAVFYKIGIEKEKTDPVQKVQVYASDVQESLLKQDLSNLNGGIVDVDNFLFIYGTQGTVIWSERQNPFSFVGASSGRINISHDKVIYASGVRGGNNPPTLLFWTMNSVVRMSNQSNENEENSELEFQVDIITQESSILSSRSVVEYDGMFFWLGIDRMFFYNGVVREMVNNTNFDWFFDLLDVNRRQLVFGIKNSEKGEIWWFFPTNEKKRTENNDEVPLYSGCSEALIYNIRDNTWYNTKIQRDCGFFNGESGKMITYGQKLVKQDTLSYIWVHEEGVLQVSDDGTTTIGIESTYTTPIISFTAFSPAGEGGGQNNDIWIDRIEPDFKLALGDEMIMKINAKDYADQVSTVISDNIIIKGQGGKVDLRAQGRNISFTFSSQANFVHGYPLIGIRMGNARG